MRAPAERVFGGIAPDAHEVAALLDHAHAPRLPRLSQLTLSVREPAVIVRAAPCGVLVAEFNLVLQALEPHVPLLATPEADHVALFASHERAYGLHACRHVDFLSSIHLTYL